jgi:aspartate aminotransferase-like enzyme
MEIYRDSFFPGPTSVPEDVLKIGLKNFGSADIEPEFLELYYKCTDNLKLLFNTNNDVVVMSGEGMLALWSGIKSCLTKDDKVLVLSTGYFGSGFADMAKCIGCKVEKIEFPLDCSFEDYDLIEDKIRQFKPKMITAVHCETPSGILNDLTVIGKLKAQYNIPLLCVDAVSSVGATNVDVDKHNIDICFGGSQKVLSTPPNACFLSVSNNAWKYAQDINYQGYDALIPFKQAPKTGNFPYTPSLINVAQLYQASKDILDEGLENVVARHKLCSKMTIDLLKKTGIKLFPKKEEYSSPTVTAAYVPEKYSWQEFDNMLRKQGICIGGNFWGLAGKVFRIGHMGSQAYPNNIEKLCGLL